MMPNSIHIKSSWKKVSQRHRYKIIYEVELGTGKMLWEWRSPFWPGWCVKGAHGGKSYVSGNWKCSAQWTHLLDVENSKEPVWLKQRVRVVTEDSGLRGSNLPEPCSLPRTWRGRNIKQRQWSSSRGPWSSMLQSSYDSRGITLAVKENKGGRDNLM